MGVLFGEGLYKLLRAYEGQPLQFYVGQLLGDVIRGGAKFGDVRLKQAKIAF